MRRDLLQVIVFSFSVSLHLKLRFFNVNLVEVGKWVEQCHWIPESYQITAANVNNVELSDADV